MTVHRARVSVSVAALVLATWAGFAACASTHRVPQNVPVNASAMDPPATAVKPPRRVPPMSSRDSQVRLNPNELVLPEAPENASGAVHDFVLAADHAVRQAYQADNDDPSVLLALQESLRTRADLKALASVWHDILQSALARAESLQAVGPALRPIRASLRAATLEPGGETIQGMDIGICQSAFTSPVGRNKAIDGIIVTFQSVGTFSLGQVREACDTANRAALQKSKLPGKPAPAKISRMVRRLFADAHLGGDVRKVAVITPWHRDKAKHAMAMRAAVVIAETDEASGQGCTMARLAVIRSLRGNAAPALVELGAREPILCSQLR